MRMPKQAAGESLELKMTPMIDVVFLLLVFFVWTNCKFRFLFLRLICLWGFPGIVTRLEKRWKYK